MNNEEILKAALHIVLDNLNQKKFTWVRLNPYESYLLSVTYDIDPNFDVLNTTETVQEHFDLTRLDESEG